MAILPENLLEPLSEESPCGVPASELKDYEKLREARRPNDAAIESFMSAKGVTRPMPRELFAPKEPQRVIGMLVDMLGTRSKDLELAAWLCEALLWKDGLAGFVEGLNLIRGLLERYWDQLHPLPDEDGDTYMRVKQVEWIGSSESKTVSSPPMAIGFVPVTANGITLNQYVDTRSIPPETDTGSSAVERREEALASGKLPPEEFEVGFDATPKQFYKDLKAAAIASREAVTALEELCAAKFPTDPPSFTQIQRAIEKAETEAQILLRKKLEKDPDPIDLSAPAGADGAAGGAGGPGAAVIPPAAALAFDEMVAAVGEVTGLDPASPQEAVVRIAVAARYLRRLNPSNPMAYLLMRGMRWGELYSGGAELPGGSLVAPATEVRTTLKQLSSGHAWAEVLELTEAAMATECGRAWLDLQRYAAKAATELGYEGVARGIKMGVKHLLEDFPALASATLLDDTGAANPETATWLNEIKQGDQGGNEEES